MMRFFPSRKASVEITLQQIIGAIIAAIVILATLSLFIGLMNIFTGPPDTGSLANLEKIYDTITALYDPKNMNDSCVVKASYIQADWTIVGMNADGVQAADNSFYCSLGGDCVEESCGADQNIKKPSQCGRGPCLCLCQGGGDLTGTGDTDGDDCQEGNAVCKKFPTNIGFDQFFFPNDATEDGPAATLGLAALWNAVASNYECGITRTLSNGQSRHVCDLVLESESCWLGKDYKTQYSVVIGKIKVSDNPGAHEGLYFDAIKTDEVQRYYPGVPGCSDIIADMKKFRGTQLPQQAPPAAAAGEQGDTVLEQVDQTKKGQAVTVR
jgi:hypothetical protein